MNNNCYDIRFMKKDDLSQVYQIDKEAFPTQWPPTNYRNELQNSLARYLVAFKKSSPEKDTKSVGLSGKGVFTRIKRFFGYHDTISEQHSEDIIVGFVGGWIMVDELHITEIATRASYQNQGIGHLMLIAIIETAYALKARIGTLEVRVSNVTAQRIYDKFGFVKVGFRKAYYNDNKEDAIIMTTHNFSLPEYQERLARLKSELAKKLGVSELPAVKIPGSAKY